MAEKSIGALVVTEGEQVVGIITERDYARKVILMARSSKDTPVRGIMTSSVMYVRSDNTSEECMLLMTENRLRHLPNEISVAQAIGDVPAHAQNNDLGVELALHIDRVTILAFGHRASPSATQSS
jgi:signal-transduction protein with cAMP-binding, CBS, and nucleotidyltransferase domain